MGELGRRIAEARCVIVGISCTSSPFKHPECAEAAALAWLREQQADVAKALRTDSSSVVRTTGWDRVDIPPTPQEDRAVEVVARSLSAVMRDEFEDECIEEYAAMYADWVMGALRSALQGPHAREVAEGLGMVDAGRCEVDGVLYLTERHFRLPTKEDR